MVYLPRKENIGNRQDLQANFPKVSSLEVHFHLVNPVQPLIPASANNRVTRCRKARKPVIQFSNLQSPGHPVINYCAG
jgi:hypothetical protein